MCAPHRHGRRAPLPLGDGSAGALQDDGMVGSGGEGGSGDDGDSAATSEADDSALEGEDDAAVVGSGDEGGDALQEQALEAGPGPQVEPPPDLYQSREAYGFRFARDRFVSNTDPAKDYDRLTVHCRVHGSRCFKKRAIGAAQQVPLGPWQPIAFLAVWASQGASMAGQRDHVQFKPTLEQQRAWLTAHGLR